MLCYGSLDKPCCVRECFKSIFRIHTETGNIWTHLLGVVAFLGLAIYFITRLEAFLL